MNGKDTFTGKAKRVLIIMRCETRFFRALYRLDDSINRIIVSSSITGAYLGTVTRTTVIDKGRLPQDVIDAARAMFPAFKVGHRVELSPATDEWMRGNRFGQVTKVDGDTISVRLDKSRSAQKFHIDLVQGS